MRVLIFIFLSLNILSANSLEQKANRLIKAYPLFFKAYLDNKIIWSDKTIQIFDDKREKSFEERLNSADLEDMFFQKYPNSFENPKKNCDSGRYRNEYMFKKMYGSSKKEIEKNLVTIKWFDKKIRVTKINNIDKKLIKISKELNKLPKKMKKYLKNSAGGYNYRVISGTKRLSTHSFGIAIDINIKYSNYWRWSKNLKYKNKIPQEIVKIFEKEGFIWGGKWYHYDTMHFEYRPELLNF